MGSDYCFRHHQCFYSFDNTCVLDGIEGLSTKSDINFYGYRDPLGRVIKLFKPKLLLVAVLFLARGWLKGTQKNMKFYRNIIRIFIFRVGGRIRFYRLYAFTVVVCGFFLASYS